MDKTHYRKAFNSPYLSSADIVEPTDLTISHVRLEPDKTKKTKDLLNTAYFKEREIRKGEALKPMVLNATNSKMLANEMDKTHYRKAFNSPYLSSADIVEPTDLTISHVRLEPDYCKKLLLIVLTQNLWTIKWL